MMEKSALAGEGGGARIAQQPPFSLLPSRTKLQCTLLLRGRYTPSISSLRYHFISTDVGVTGTFLTMAVGLSGSQSLVVEHFIGSQIY